MPKFTVRLEKCMWMKGYIDIKAKDGDAAQDLVQQQINNGEMQTIDPRIEWDDDDLTYEDETFNTTGDVEQCDE